MRVGLSLIGLCILAACSTQAPDPIAPANPVPVAAADTCGAAPYGYLVGQNATALEKVLILRQVRIIRPNQAVTLDLRPERINFKLGADEQIRAITCG